jgi:hypothetical protein
VIDVKFSLINVSQQDGDKVAGRWIQDHIGDLASASACARQTEAANSNRITVAVVEELVGTNLLLSGPCLPTLRLDVAE